MKKKKLTFQNLIYDNRIVLAFSLVTALIIWLVVAIQFSPEDDRVVEGVPVKIEVSNNVMNLGLEMFGKTDYKVDVKVHGKRYEVAESVLSADDIVVTAKTNYVDSAGSHVLKLEVNAKDPQSMDYDIISVSRSSITVYFDYYKEGEYALEPDIEMSDSVEIGRRMAASVNVRLGKESLKALADVLLCRKFKRVSASWMKARCANVSFLLKRG